MTTARSAAQLDDPVNLAILAVSEDRLQGFQRDPFGEISRRAGIPVAVVLERIRSMLEAGIVRRVRQTVLATNLARGALVAWSVPPHLLDAGFAFMFQEDPFSGHVVIRSTDQLTAGSRYRLWTTLKVPQGYSLERYADFLARKIGAESYRLMPAKRLFALGVGHVRRRGIEPGARSDAPGRVIDTEIVELSEQEWRVLTSLKREFAADELQLDLWAPRAAEACVSLDEFHEIADLLNERGIVGRFSTFLEHVKPLADGQRVTQYNALFHWAVPPGREIEAGCEVGRHEIMTHAYWREGGPEFGNVNIMGVAHGLDKDLLLAHKASIDTHLRDAGIPVSYTNVFWGGRSEIKPSEISPVLYRAWCQQNGLDPDSMRSFDAP